MYYLNAYSLIDMTLGSYTSLDLCDHVEHIVFVGISLVCSEKGWNTLIIMDYDTCIKSIYV